MLNPSTTQSVPGALGVMLYAAGIVLAIIFGNFIGRRRSKNAKRIRYIDFYRKK